MAELGNESVHIILGQVNRMLDDQFSIVEMREATLQLGLSIARDVLYSGLSTRDTEVAVLAGDLYNTQRRLAFETQDGIHGGVDEASFAMGALDAYVLILTNMYPGRLGTASEIAATPEVGSVTSIFDARAKKTTKELEARKNGKGDTTMDRVERSADPFSEVRSVLQPGLDELLADLSVHTTENFKTLQEIAELTQTALATILTLRRLSPAAQDVGGGDSLGRISQNALKAIIETATVSLKSENDER